MGRNKGKRKTYRKIRKKKGKIQQVRIKINEMTKY